MSTFTLILQERRYLILSFSFLLKSLQIPSHSEAYVDVTYTERGIMVFLKLVMLKLKKDYSEKNSDANFQLFGKVVGYKDMKEPYQVRCSGLNVLFNTKKVTKLSPKCIQNFVSHPSAASPFGLTKYLSTHVLSRQGRQ